MRATFVTVILVAAAGALFSPSARADHICDALGEPGWSTVPSREVLSVVEAAPYRVGADWFVERTSTVLPLCNYINAGGNYSLRSYSLSPEDETERVMICRAGTAVASYAGPLELGLFEQAQVDAPIRQPGSPTDEHFNTVDHCQHAPA
jgi:hypothetical protein